MEHTITLRGDGDSLTKALLEILDAPLETLDGLPDVSQLIEQIACVEVASMPTLPTGEIVVRFKPSNRLDNLVAAIRTLERDRVLGKKIGHSSDSITHAVSSSGSSHG
jgi:hypothetical protein